MTLPGESAHFRSLVTGTQITVRIELRLKASPWITTTGRRKPGPDPMGWGRSVHHTSPVRSPLGGLEDLPDRLLSESVRSRVLTKVLDDAVHRLGDIVRLMTRHVLAEDGAVHLAA